MVGESTKHEVKLLCLVVINMYQKHFVIKLPVCTD